MHCYIYIYTASLFYPTPNFLYGNVGHARSSPQEEKHTVKTDHQNTSDSSDNDDDEPWEPSLELLQMTEVSIKAEIEKVRNMKIVLGGGGSESARC